MKIKDYIPPYNVFTWLEININGDYYNLDEAKEKYPEYEMREEYFKQLEEDGYDEFFESFAKAKTEKEIKNLADELTDLRYGEDTKETNVRFLLELFFVEKHHVESWKLLVIEKWAHRYIDVLKETGNRLTQDLTTTDSSVDTSTSKTNDYIQTDKKIGSKYARTHYNEIKKFLPVEGTVAAAVRAFDSQLSKTENNNVSKVILKFLKDENINPPFLDL